MIIGVTGFVCAGKDEVGKILTDLGFIRISLSDEIRSAMREQGVELTRKNIQDFGDLYRRRYGAGYWAQRALGNINFRKNYVIESIRNPAEVAVFRSVNDFILVGVKASPELRFNRMKARARELDPITFEAFLELEKKDRGDTEAPYGQQNGKTLKLVDYELLNEGSIEDLTHTVREFLERNLRFSPTK